jgi:hypothetical protein
MRNTFLPLLACLPFFAAAPSLAQAPYSFTMTLDMTAPRAAAIAVDVTDNAFDQGLILIAGGYHTPCCTFLKSAELYELRTGTFKATGSLRHSRRGAAAIAIVSLRTDRQYYDAVVFGGDVAATAPPRRNYEFYDTRRGRFTAVRPLLTDRFPAVMARSGNGQFGGFVLFGGQGHPVNRTRAEVHSFNEVFLEAPWPPFLIGLQRPRDGATATTLRDGRILIVGGSGSAGNTAEVYDPATGVMTAVGDLAVRRTRHTATVIGPFNAEKVLIAGGVEINDAGGIVAHHASAEIFDPATNRFTPAGSLTGPRADHTATAFSISPTGRKVLIAGGRDHVGRILHSSEIYDVETATFSPGSGMTMARYEHLAIPIGPRRILLAGGHATGHLTTRRAEIFHYPYTP